MTNRLWAPWRMPFIQKTHEEKTKRCIFCQARDTVGKTERKKGFVLAQTGHAVAMLNIFPYNNGHLMVAPRQHTGDFGRVLAAEWKDMMALLERCRLALEETLHPGGYNVGINIGRAAGAGIEDHLHMHMVPRWSGDGNFMPILSATKVLPQALSESYDQILRAMNKKKKRI